MEIAQGIYGGVVGLAVLGFALYAIVVCFLKGKPVAGALGIVGLVAAGLLAGLVEPTRNAGGGAWILLIPAVVGAIRLAKPGSRWATRRYDRSFRALSQARFPDLVDPESRVTNADVADHLDGWTTQPPHARELIDALSAQVAVPGRWVVSETPNDVVYRKPLIPHVVMLIALVVFFPLWPIVVGIWLYIGLIANEQRHRLTFADEAGLSVVKLDRGERSYPIGLSRTAWRQAPEAEVGAEVT